MKTAYDIIIKPVITEQSMEEADEKKYVFKVAVDANKIEIKKAIEEIDALAGIGILLPRLMKPVTIWSILPSTAPWVTRRMRSPGLCNDARRLRQPSMRRWNSKELSPPGTSSSSPLSCRKADMISGYFATSSDWWRLSSSPKCHSRSSGSGCSSRF